RARRGGRRREPLASPALSLSIHDAVIGHRCAEDGRMGEGTESGSLQPQRLLRDFQPEAVDVGVLVNALHRAVDHELVPQAVGVIMTGEQHVVRLAAERFTLATPDVATHDRRPGPTDTVATGEAEVAV